MRNILNPGKRFIAWLTRAREREARRANNTSKVLAVFEALHDRVGVRYPKDPARYGDYIIYYGRADDILALREAGGIALNKVVVGGLRPSDFLLRYGFAPGNFPQAADDLQDVIAALPLIDFDRKALSCLSQSDRPRFEFVRAELNLGHLEKQLLRGLIKTVQERTPQPNAA